MRLKGNELDYGLREYLILTGFLLMSAATITVIDLLLFSKNWMLSVVFGLFFMLFSIIERKYLFNFTTRKYVLLGWYKILRTNRSC